MTFAEFIESVDAELRARIAAEYGLYTGPHAAFWQRGPFTARVREGTANDVELQIVNAADETHRIIASCDAAGAERVAAAIAANADGAA